MSDLTTAIQVKHERHYGNYPFKARGFIVKFENDCIVVSTDDSYADDPKIEVWGVSSLCEDSTLIRVNVCNPDGRNSFTSEWVMPNSLYPEGFRNPNDLWADDANYWEVHYQAGHQLAVGIEFQDNVKLIDATNTNPLYKLLTCIANGDFSIAPLDEDVATHARLLATYHALSDKTRSMVKEELVTLGIPCMAALDEFDIHALSTYDDHYEAIRKVVSKGKQDGVLLSDNDSTKVKMQTFRYMTEGLALIALYPSVSNDLYKLLRTHNKTRLCDLSEARTEYVLQEAMALCNWLMKYNPLIQQVSGDANNV